ncbi:hypothetical protein NDY24_22210 [Xanthomonas hortorum pv. pelargonii]|nr:hypothetical protein NDY24_22210 [Xanthomonas hortorum pv. pelargonii]
MDHQGHFLFFGKLKDIAAGIVGKILSSFGLTIVSFEAVLPRLKEVITEQASGLSGPAMDFLGYLGVGRSYVDGAICADRADGMEGLHHSENRR